MAGLAFAGREDLCSLWSLRHIHALGAWQLYGQQGNINLLRPTDVIQHSFLKNLEKHMQNPCTTAWCGRCAVSSDTAEDRFQENSKHWKKTKHVPSNLPNILFVSFMFKMFQFLWLTNIQVLFSSDSSNLEWLLAKSCNL